MNTLSKLQCYMGRRKFLFPLSLFLSALSALAGLVPYMLIWQIIKCLLIPERVIGMNVIMYAWLAVAVSVGAVVLYFAALMASHLSAFRVEANLRRKAMHSLLEKPLGFFDVNTSGRIRKIIDDNASVTHTFLAHQLPDLAAAFLVPFVAMVLFFYFDWRMGAACLIPIVLSMLLMGYLMGVKGREFMKRYMDALEEMNTEAVEYVRGIPVVKVFRQTIYSFKAFYRSIMNYNRMVTAYTLMWCYPMSAYTVIINGFAFFLVPLSILMIGRSGDYAEVITDFLFFILITPVFSQCIMKSMYLNQAVSQAGEAISRLEHLLDFDSFPESAVSSRPERYDVEFRDVVFSYPGSRQKVLNGISFHLLQGQTYALVGASGSGKTTIARLIPRFWDVKEGDIRIGGISVRDIPKEILMNNVFFVFQRTKLFKTTLMENIKYGCPNASLEDVERAVDAAQCREIINRLPKGLETLIGADGTYLSGGEQQRIILARAILKNAPIVVLDEATAFADPENEHLIRLALKELTRGKTVLMIAHRLSTVIDADRILVIENGCIVEQGTHMEMLLDKGVYETMWKEYNQSVKWTVGKEVNND